MQERNPTSQEPGPGQHSFTSDAALHSLATTGERDFFGEPFRPRRGFRGAHAQTIAGNFLPRRNQLPPPEDRLFIVHGLEGSSESGYVIGTGSKAWCAGMNVVRMNMRNCGNTESLGPTLYNSSMSADVGAVAEALIAEERLQKLAFAGFSMGGNLVLKLLGEWGENAPPEVVAGIGVSPSMDLAPSADALHDRANRVYEMKFLWGLRRRMQRKAALYPGVYDLRYLRGLRSLRDFDDQITARYCGFLDAQDYYTRASASNVLDRITVPTLILHAADDPFIRILPATQEKLLHNPHIAYLETEHGGHCAFLAEANGYDGRWAERQAIAFLQRIQSGEPASAVKPASG